jgi:hypothetical protein
MRESEADRGVEASVSHAGSVLFLACAPACLPACLPVYLPAWARLFRPCTFAIVSWVCGVLSENVDLSRGDLGGNGCKHLVLIVSVIHSSDGIAVVCVCVCVSVSVSAVSACHTRALRVICWMCVLAACCWQVRRSHGVVLPVADLPCELSVAADDARGERHVAAALAGRRHQHGGVGWGVGWVGAPA